MRANVTGASESGREAAQPPKLARKRLNRRGRYHLVVIGGGTAGLVSAAIAAQLGASVALIEAHRMGGDCLNYGCVPSKALIATARVRALQQRCNAFGLPPSAQPPIDFGQVLASMRHLQARIAVHDSPDRFRSLGVDVYLGRARFAGPDKVVVGAECLRFRRAIIATGARPRIPNVPGLRSEMCLTNESVFSLAEFPRRLAVLGAGPVGCELAQVFARFGSEVALIETEHGVLPRDERDAAELVRQGLERDGVRVLCCGRSLRVEETRDGLRLDLHSHGKEIAYTCDRILIATGRTPNVECLDLEAAGVAYEVGKGVQVDDRLRTTNRRIYAAGDVCGHYQFTHAADAMARIAVTNALFFGRRRLSKLVIPWCTYTDPELGHVGLTRSQAEERGIRFDEIVQPLEGVDRAVLDRDSEGFVRVLVRRGSDRILGATAVGGGAGEMICQLSLALTHGIGLRQFAATVFPYPTRAEAVRKLGDAYLRSRLTPGVRRLIGLLLQVFG